MTPIVRVVNRAYLVAATPAALTLRTALRDPRRAQMKILHHLASSNRECEFGRAHGFASIDGYADFVDRVPIGEYDDIGGEIERVRNGGRAVLTRDPVEFLEPTGGSSGPSKLIPYTKTLKRQIAAAAHPWIRDLIALRAELKNGRSYWAVSPPAPRFDDASSAVRIGAERDLDYLPRPVASFIERTLVLPRAVSDVDDLAAARYVTLRSLLAAGDLAFISVWSPSFLTLLMDELDRRFEMLLYDLERGRISIPLAAAVRGRLEHALPARPDVAARLRRRFGSVPPADLGELWRHLRTISCWTDGHAGRAVVPMRRRFPEVEIQGKGLVATEGIASVPLSNHPAPVAAVTSHFLEFIPETGGDPRLVDELEDGCTYEVVITTGGGLYRYRLKDIVEVDGYVERTPMLRFVGRADAASDLCGEKLTPAFVEQALASAAHACGVRPAFAMLSPRWDDPPCYDLWIEPAVSDTATEERAALLADAVDGELRRAYHYDLCRSLGQLAPVRLRIVHDAQRTYERACTTRGQRAGVVKPRALIADLTWGDVFEEAMN